MASQPEQPVGPNRKPSRRGSHVRQRVQVLIVAAIVFLLGALVITGIDQARQKARYMGCKNNLRLIGNGLHSYADFHGKFPAATVPNANLPPERRVSWMFEIDPYVHARMDPDWKAQRGEPWDSVANVRLARDRVPWYLCPATPAKTDANGLGLTHYVGLTGIGEDAGTLPKGHPRGGAFNYERGIRFNEFVDTVDSVMLIETSLHNGPWIAGGRSTARPFDPDGLRPVGPGAQFGGLYRGGVIMMSASVHVFFVRDTVSPKVLAAHITIAAGDSPLPFDD